MQTPLWVPLFVAGLGLLGTIAGTVTGVVLTQRQATRREALARQHERKRQQEQWTREDGLRTFDQRRTAYIEFYESLRDTGLVVYYYGRGRGESALPPDFQLGASF